MINTTTSDCNSSVTTDQQLRDGVKIPQEKKHFFLIGWVYGLMFVKPGCRNSQSFILKNAQLVISTETALTLWGEEFFNISMDALMKVFDGSYFYLKTFIVR